MGLIKNLEYSADGFQINIKSFEYVDGELLFIKGPSGVGKSTFFSLLCDFVSPNLSWQWVDSGLKLSELNIGKRNLAYVQQGFDMFDQLTALENIKIVMQSRKVLSDEKINLMYDMAKELGVDYCLNTKAAHLSGGERQRISILRALVSNPFVIILDEPFSALDMDSKIKSKAVLLKFLKTNKVTTFITTHDEDDLNGFVYKTINVRGDLFQ